MSGEYHGVSEEYNGDCRSVSMSEESDGEYGGVTEIRWRVWEE